MKKYIGSIITGLFIMAFLIGCIIQAPINQAVGSLWSLLPPVVAIGLALITKEVYSSLLAGCVVGALLTEGFAPWRSFETLFLTLMEGIDLKIFFFDVLLGAIVVLFARSGGSRAFGEWASRRVRSAS